MSVAILWHMHQPDYRDEQGVFFMPWVFLHAIKDYYDMPYIAIQYNVKLTFNLTPILLEQLQCYIQKGPLNDRFLSLLLKHPSRLEQTERDFVQKICKTVQFETMVKPLPYFAKLFEKKEYSHEEFIDLEVWFLLAWCGNYLRRNDPMIGQSLQKKSFGQEEKERLVDQLFAFLPKIVPFYNELFQKGSIALSTTPYTHPILPLLLDIHVAKEANPNTFLPMDGLSLKDDAIMHIKKAKEIYKTHFGQNPKGFWPAEGAVDEKSVKLYKEHGIEWIATDEAILKKSGGDDPHAIYEYDGVKIFFRDHTLSDLIGFVYRHFDAKEAAEDFMKRIQKDTFVILDGENAWEYYPQNGLPFLQSLYERLQTIETFTFDEATQKSSNKLSRLAPGSWIYGDFNTWVGDEEKNRAWDLLFQTKRDFYHHPSDDLRIQQHFLDAEASDWFWWYGEGHYTEYAKEFDKLFRNHLIQIYKILGLSVPKDLLSPIVGSHTIHTYINEPKEYIYPIIDGRITSFFEWLGSGYLDERGDTMQSNELVQRIFWGENEESLFFRLDSQRPKELDVTIYFDEETVTPDAIAKDEIIEIEISKKSLHSQKFEVRFEILENGKIVQILPSLTRLFIQIGNDYAKNWFV